jgi:hypothetical protein
LRVFLLNNRNFVRVSSGPELGAYYHEFFLRDRPQLAAQMFCKNDRTKIAMAPTKPEPTPAPMANEMEPQPFQHAQQPQQQKLLTGVDPAQMFLSGQGMDSQTQMLLEQQLAMMKQQEMQQQQQQNNAQNALQNQLLGMLDIMDNNGNDMNLFQGHNSNNMPINLQQQMQEVQAQKQQQAGMLQLQQLMALNLQRQQKRHQTSNNFRASAA